MERNTVKVCSGGQMGLLIQGSSMIITSMVKALINGQTEGNTRVNGRITRCMAQAFSNGLMVDVTKDNMWMIKRKARALLNGKFTYSYPDFVGLTGGNTQDSGLMESNMEEDAT